MSDPRRKHLLALRLASAASSAWSFLQAEINELDNTREAAEVYMAAIARLSGFVLHANEALAHQTFPEAELDRIMEAWVKDVKDNLEGIRQRECNLAEAEPEEVH